MRTRLTERDITRIVRKTLWEQEQIKHVDKETDWLDDTELEEQQCNL